MEGPKLFLEVSGGMDHGARIELDDIKRILGRASDCDLVLGDVAVSRRHATVVRTERGTARFETCVGASPAVVAGRTHHRLDLEPGTELLLGNTTIVVRSGDPEQAAASGPNQSEEQTVRAGAGVAAWHLTALNTLLEALDTVDDVTELESRIRTWCVEHSMATDARLDLSPDGRDRLALADDGDGMVRLSVPVPSDGMATLTFTCRPSAGGVPESLRRALVMAGRLLASALARTRRLRVVVDENAALRAMSFGSARAFLGSSPAATQLSRLIPRLSASDVNVLLEGETGSGKSFVARLIHEQGPRARESLRVINCAAIPEALIESELFGHERGAFTGAVAPRAGALDAAGRGTVFLDEIGELPLPSQAKLLRVLEERRFERLGSNRTIPFEARVICATNRDLQAMVSSGEFRSDLFFRIAVIRARVPPLRERGEDLLLLAEHILRDLAPSAGRRFGGFSQGALETIAHYSWPGNVRELRNAIEHALVLGEGPWIEPSDLPPGIAVALDQESSPDRFRVTLPANLAWIERRTIEAALAVTGGNRTRAAALLGINRQTIYNKLAESESGAPENSPAASKKGDRR
jgi:DNA-binding NtrC family response regulator